jgi:hypothetical protein
MLMPLPATLRRLISQYEMLLAEEAPDSAQPPSEVLRDLAYTLCVSTGTREITDALDTARSYLAKAAAVPSAAAVEPHREQRPAAGVPASPPIASTVLPHEVDRHRGVAVRTGRRTVSPVARAGQVGGR